jgi:hypothetical protein
MTEEEYMSICKSHWAKFKELNESTNLYDHEKDLDEKLVNFGRDLLQSSVGSVPADHRKKKNC